MSLVELKSNVKVDGVQYILQHPGTRAWIQIQHTLNEMTAAKNGEVLIRMNMEKLLDYCFENVISPEGHGFSPSLDNVIAGDDPVRALKAVEEWQAILPRFLRGSFKELVESKPNDGQRSKPDPVPDPEGLESRHPQEDESEPDRTIDVAGDSSRDDSPSRRERNHSRRHNRSKRGGGFLRGQQERGQNADYATD